MATRQDRTVRRQISTLFNIGVIRDLTDGQLLERFSTGQGEAAELAFAALVERHGPMVLRVCRARLFDPHEAMDAFQATFLVLVEKSRGLWVRDSLGPWLHQVASRTSSCAQAASARRRRVERTAAELAAATEPHDDEIGSEWERALHEEINRLPERYRVAIVLCDLEGQTCEEAARRIGRPVGTIKCWRARGRERLRQRLIRSGLTPSCAVGAALAANVARATMQGPEAADAARALADCLTAGVVPASVQALVKGVFKAMILSKLKMAAAVICVMAFIAGGLGTAARVAAKDPQRPSDKAQREPVPPSPSTGKQVPTVTSPLEGLREENWPLSLRDAIRIGLDNCEVVRVRQNVQVQAVGGSKPTALENDSVDRSMDADYVIQAVGSDVNAQRFKAEVMAHVRSIEQQYWNLSQQYVRLWAVEKVVDLIDGVVKLEQAKFEVGRGTYADIAEATQRLEQSRLDLVTRTSDVITTERQLRHLLGLPGRDNRCIVPVSVPVEAKVEPDWDSSLSIMLEKQPDVVQAKLKAREAARRGSAAVAEAVTRTFLSDLASQGTGSPSSDPTHQDPAALQSDSVKQIIHQTTHSLARFFLEVDANYKQYKTASRLRAAAAQRLEAQRAYYEEGRITIDRFLDAVSQYAQAVGQEAQFKTTYNISLVALEEAKGTLLEYDKITVVAHPEAENPGNLKLDGAAKAASFESPVPAPTVPVPTPARDKSSSPEPPKPTAITGETQAVTPRVDSAGRTVSFQVTINLGSRPVEIKGSFTVSPAESRDGARTR